MNKIATRNGQDQSREAAPQRIKGTLLSLSGKELRQLADHAVRTDFHEFIRRVFATVDPSQAFIPNWHIEAICQEVLSFLKGDETHLVVNLPPRSLKSIIFSVALPAWLLGHEPSRQIVCISYSDVLADKHARDTQQVMQTDWYRRIFPRTRIDRVNANGLSTTRRGYRRSTTVNGTLTGLGGDIFIIDDPIKADEALSDAIRNKTNQWFGSTLASRANNLSTVKMMLVMQRVHMEDPSALYLDQGARHLCLPAIADLDRSIQILHGRQHHWKAGEPLDAARLSLGAIDMLKQQLGERNFSAQYLQMPVPVDGELIKWSWFQSYDAAPVFEYGDLLIHSWDTAMMESKDADYSVCTTWLVRDNNFYLMDVVRERLGYPDLKRRIVEQRRRSSHAVLLIEEKASGISVIQDLTRERVGVIAIKAVDNKSVRAATASVVIEGCRVHLPKSASWLDAFKLECLAFPNGRHDDQVDSMTQAINWHEGRQIQPTTLFGYY